MKFIKKTVILSHPEGGGYDSLKLESSGGGVYVSYAPSAALFGGGGLLGIKEKSQPIRISSLVFPLTKLAMSEDFGYGDFAEFIFVNPQKMAVVLYGNTHSTYPDKTTLLDGFYAYFTKSDKKESKAITQAEKQIKAETQVVKQIKSDNKAEERVEIQIKTENQIETQVVKQIKTDNKAEELAEKQIKNETQADKQISAETAIMVEKEKPITAQNAAKEKQQITQTVNEEKLQIAEKKVIATSKASDTEYYDSIKKDIEDLLKTKPPIQELSDKIEGSRWAKIDDGDTYIVGVIFEGKKPLFVCYGVYGDINNPIGAEYNFVEMSNGKGYWLIYQNASDGEIVRNL